MKGFLFLLLLVAAVTTHAQPLTGKAYRDSILMATQLHLVDSLKAGQSKAPVWADTLLYAHHPYLRFTNPSRFIIVERKWQGKEAVFYCVVGVILFFALIKNSFNRYIKDLFNLFFRTTLRQRQIKEQLLQTPLPSLLLNISFVVSVGLFVTLMFLHFNMLARFSFWYLLLYSLVAVSGIYFVKFITLKFCGWLFNLSESMDTYIFIVFTANKILGILLLPFLVFVGFSTDIVYQTALSLSLVVIAGIFIYRFYLTYVSLHQKVKISLFHFCLYLAAFEVLPLLLINKVLFRIL